jgi:hypothetical protein
MLFEGYQKAVANSDVRTAIFSNLCGRLKEAFSTSLLRLGID